MSLFYTNWKVFSSNLDEAPSGFEEYHPRIAELLLNRGINTKEDAEIFFNPDYQKHTHDPHLLKDAERAAERINKAIEAKEKIYIYGDYDADGVCASTLLKSALEDAGASSVPVYIPHREKEGYGMNMDAVKNIVSGGADLIITVDCGSANKEEASYAQENGSDVIVTDHHQVLPARRSLGEGGDDNHTAYAFVNPQRPSCEYPFPNICGTAVAFKLIQILFDLRRSNGGHAPDEGKEKWLLDLVGLATVTDVMPLRDENRVFVKYGLFVLAQTKRPGLRALLESADITPHVYRDLLSTNINTFHLGFIIGPRINAAGRMDHAELAFDVLNSPDMKTARKNVSKLEEKNVDRKDIVEDIATELKEEELNKEVIVAGRENWPIGVLGIVAGRLCEKHNKPALLYQKKEEAFIGSARTPEYINTVDILKQAEDILEKFGGHEQAGGFTGAINKERDFQDRVGAYVEKVIQNMDPAALQPTLNIDTELREEDINMEFYKNLSGFTPYGEGNTEPVFLLKDVYVSNQRMVGKNSSHFKCDIIKNDARWSAIGFNFREAADSIGEGDNVDIAFNLRLNEWNGRKHLDLRLKDISKNNQDTRYKKQTNLNNQ